MIEREVPCYFQGSFISSGSKHRSGTCRVISGLDSELKAIIESTIVINNL